ncbi:MAG: DUF5615 family PIN-like protein [Acidobacteriota bacterium]
MGTLASELRSLARDMANVPRVYADANIPAGAVSFMRHHLHWDVLFVVEDDHLRRASDAAHFARAIELGRTLITLDRDFLDDGRFPPALGPGVIVCVVTEERTLVQLLRHVDREVLGAAVNPRCTIAGLKLALTPDVRHFTRDPV